MDKRSIKFAFLVTLAQILATAGSVPGLAADRSEDEQINQLLARMRNCTAEKCERVSSRELQAMISRLELPSPSRQAAIEGVRAKLAPYESFAKQLHALESGAPDARQKSIYANLAKQVDD